MTDADGRNLTGQAAKRGGEKEDQNDKKPEDQVADGGAAGLLRGWLRRFHAQGASSHQGLSPDLAPASALSLA